MKMFMTFGLVASLLAGCGEGGNNSPTPGEQPQASATPVKYTSGQEVTFKVDGMHCQMNCYPKVKKALEEVDGIASVQLVPQKDDVAIDDPRVVIKLDGDLTSTDAIAALQKVNFTATPDDQQADNSGASGDTNQPATDTPAGDGQQKPAVAE